MGAASADAGDSSVAVVGVSSVVCSVDVSVVVSVVCSVWVV